MVVTVLSPDQRTQSRRSEARVLPNQRGYQRPNAFGRRRSAAGSTRAVSLSAPDPRKYARPFYLVTFETVPFEWAEGEFEKRSLWSPSRVLVPYKF